MQGLWRRRRRVLVTAAVLVVGIAASATAAAAARRTGARDADSVLDRRTAVAVSAVRAEAKRYADTLREVAAALGAQRDLRAADFDTITAPLVRAHLNGASGIVLLVPATDAQVPAVQAHWRRQGSRLVARPVGTGREHLITVLTRSLDGTPSLPGRDLSSFVEPALAVAEARRSGEVTVSDTYVLVKDRNLPAEQQQLSFVLVAPVYGVPPAGAAGAPGTFRGWVLMGLRGRSFVSGTLRDVSQGLINVTLAATTSRGAEVDVATVESGTAQPDAPTREVQVRVAQRQWTLRVRATDLAERLRGAYAHLDLWLGLGGLALTALLGLLVFVLTGSRDRALARVEHATARLAATEREARRQADLLGAIMNSISDGVGVVDEHGKFLLHNPAARRMLGLDQDRGGAENLQSYYGIFRPDGSTPFPTEELPLVRALAGESTEQVEMIIRNAGQPDGLPISVSGRPFEDGTGAAGAVAVFHDITVRKRAEAELSAANDRLHAELGRREAIEAELRRTRDALADQKEYLTQVLDTLDVAVVTCAADGRIVHRNRAARTWPGTDSGPATVTELAADIPVTDADGVPLTAAQIPMLRSLQGESVDGVELLLQPPGQPPRSVLVHCRPLRDAAGRIVGAVGSTYDVTTLREREAELHAFAGVVAHDLKSPLAAVAGYVELLGDILAEDHPQVAAEVAFPLDRAAMGVQRMRRLIDDLLGYVTARDAPLDPVPVDLAALVADVITDRTANLRAQGDVPFPDIFCGWLPQVRADAGMLRQVVDNLVGNAITYTPAGQTARIDISAQPADDGWVRIEVADRGIGIPAEAKPRVFDTFQRAHPTTAGGTGLGLAICQRVVARHGGTIGLADNPGGGTRVYFEIPLLDADPAESAGAAEPALASAGPKSGARDRA